MFFLFSKLLDFALSPLTWILILFSFGLFVKKQPLKKKLLTGTFIILIVFTNPFLSNRVMNMWEVTPYAMDKITGQYDVAILLGGSLRYYNPETKRPVYSQSVDRLLQTIALYKSGKVKKILLSGGSGMVMMPDEKESEIVIKVLTQSGIPEEDILLENDSRNTYENAAFSARILKKNYSKGKFLLVTSAFHMRRSMACFKKAGLSTAAYPVDEKTGISSMTPDNLIIPDASCMVVWDAILHEWFGMLTYKIAGYI